MSSSDSDERDHKHDSALQVDASTREQLLAVVVDANAYGRGKPDLTSLEFLAQRLHGIGIETWVPEPVAWEWGQHLAEDWQSVTTAGAGARKNLERGRVPMPEPLYSDAAAVIEAFRSALREIEHVRLITATPESALEGLKDQVMQRAPGKMKSAGKERVKTGASDSAWLRDVLAEADGTAERLLFITEDKDIANAFAAWGLPAPLTRGRQQLRSTLFSVTVDDGHATRAVIRYILDRLPINLESGWLGEKDSFDIGNTPSLDQAIEDAGDGDDDARVYGASVTRLTSLVGLTNVTVETNVDEAEEPQWEGDLGQPQNDEVTATVYFLGEAEAVVNRLYLGGDPEVENREYDDVFIRSYLTFHFTDGVITAVSADDDAAVSLPEDRYAKDYDALDEIHEALSVVPGLIVPDALTADRKGSFQLEVKEHEVGLELEWQAADSWAFSISLNTGSGWEFAEVACHYDDTTWVGGSDGFHIGDPYYVTVTGGDLAHGNPIWSVPAWIIKRLDWTGTTRHVSEKDDQSEG